MTELSNARTTLEKILPASWLCELTQARADETDETVHKRVSEFEALAQTFAINAELTELARFACATDDDALSWSGVRDLCIRFGENVEALCAALPESVNGVVVRKRLHDDAKARLSRLTAVKNSLSPLLDADEAVLTWSGLKDLCARFEPLSIGNDFACVRSEAEKRLSHLTQLKTALAPLLDADDAALTWNGLNDLCARFEPLSIGKDFACMRSEAEKRLSHLTQLKTALATVLCAEEVWTPGVKKLIERADDLLANTTLPTRLAEELQHKAEALRRIQHEHTQRLLLGLLVIAAVAIAAICWLIHIKQPPRPPVVPPAQSSDIIPVKDVSAEAARVIRVAKNKNAIVQGVQALEISDISDGLWNLNGNLIDLDPFDEKEQTLLSRSALTKALATLLTTTWTNEGGFFSANVPDWPQKVATLKEALTERPALSATEDDADAAAKVKGWLQNEASAPYLAFIAPWQGGRRFVIVSRDGKTVLVRTARDGNVAQLPMREIEAQINTLLLNGSRDRVPSLSWDGPSALVLLFAPSTEPEKIAPQLAQEIIAK